MSADHTENDAGVLDLDVPNAWEVLPPRRRRRHRVTVLLDPGDDAAVVATLLAAHDPLGPVVTVHPTPSTRSSMTLACDILAALGHPVTDLGKEKLRAAAAAWHSVRAWIAAEPVERLVVLRAQRLSRECLDALLELWSQTGVGLVLVFHACSRAAALAMLGPGVDARVTPSLRALTRTFPAPRAPEVDAPVEALPAVPDTDVVSFRAEAYRRCGSEEFARIDAVYRHGMSAACEWLHDHAGPARADEGPAAMLAGVYPRGLRSSALSRGAQLLIERYGESELRHLAAGLLCAGRPGRAEATALPQRFDDDDGLDCFLTGLVAESPTRGHSIALLRGAQAGALLHGLLIRLPGHFAQASGPGMTGRPIDARLAERIRAGTVGPVHSAALAIAVFTGFAPAELARIPITALSSDARMLRWDTNAPHRAGAVRRWTALSVPPRARPMLAAARTFLGLRGVEPNAALFRGAISAHGQLLPAAAARAGIVLPPATTIAASWTATASAWWVGDSLHTEVDHSR